MGAWHVVTENLDQPCKSEMRKLYTICFCVGFFEQVCMVSFGWTKSGHPPPPHNPLSFRAQSSHTVNFQLFGRMVGGSETLFVLYERFMFIVTTL